MERICVVSDGNEYVSQKVIRYLAWLSIKSKFFENNGDSEKTASELIEWYSDESASVSILNSKNYIEDYKPIFKEYGIQVFFMGSGKTSPGDDNSFIHFNGSDIIINQITSHLQSRISYFTLNLKPRPRTIYLSRHGESMFNVTGQLGGDADLSPRGFAYAKKLPELIKADTDA